MAEKKAVDAIYELDGKISVGKAIPLWLATHFGDVRGQHRSYFDCSRRN